MHLRKRAKPDQEYRVVKRARQSRRIYHRAIGPGYVRPDVWAATKLTRRIIFRICEERGAFVWQVLGRRKTIPEIAHTRWLIWKSVKAEKPDWGFTDIARRTGDWDHTSVLYGLKMIDVAEISGKVPPLPRELIRWRALKNDPVGYALHLAKKRDQDRARREKRRGAKSA